MIVDFDVKSMKTDSVLYRDKNGKIICVPKDEFLKEYYDEISSLRVEVANGISRIENLEKSIVGEISSQNERIDQLSQTIKDFVNIMKGEPVTNEENNESDE
jgi:hypothetical protein